MSRRTPALWMRRLLPRELRDEYGDDFVALLQERVDNEKANGGRVAALRYWVRGFVDVARTALRNKVGAGAPAPDAPDPERSRFVRTTAAPTSFLPVLRDELRTIDPNLVLIIAEPLTNRLAMLTTNERTYSTFTGLFGVLAAALCAVGIYGAMAHAVSQRTHEIGVRMALGARRSSLVRAVVLQGAVPAVLGVAIGTGVAMALSRIIASLLFGVSATDPLTYAAAGALVMGVSLAASWLPARRAARVDPVEPLRAQ